MKKLFASVVTHRQSLKACGLAMLGAGAGQVVVPPKPVAAEQTINDYLTVAVASPGSSELVLKGTGTGAQIARADFVSNTLTVGRVGFTPPYEVSLRSIQTAGYLSFYTGGDAGGNERLRIDAAGNVGIGRVPNYRLDVYGEIANTTYSGSYAVTRLQTWGLLSTGTMYIEPGPGSTLFIVPANWTQALTTAIWGKVGIGTQSPATELDVVGSIHLSGNLQAVGSVGIGVTSPMSKLHVQLAAGPGEGKIITLANGAGSYAFHLGTILGPYFAVHDSTEGADVMFTLKGGSKAARFYGGVGIGREASDPSYALDVVGAIRSTGTFEGTASSAYYVA